MGQTLSEPVVEKNSSHGQDNRVVYGVSCMQGWRISMEDAHACILDLKPEGSDSSSGTTEEKTRISYFGVYDGHGGDRVAIYTGDNMHKIVARQTAFKDHNFEQALKDGFLATDRALLSDPKYEDEVSGCTATVCLITHEKIFVANSGDSRTVLGVKGRAKPLSFDHKPQNEAEKSRICAAGGFVDFGRVNGNLALSRAIGDFEFKKSAELPPEQQIVTAYPDVTVHEITDNDEFVVLACDGIWDCQSSQAVIEFVRRGIAAKQDLSSICENLMDNCLASNSETGGVGCDNMTMAIVGLLKGKTRTEWYQQIADRVAKGDGPCAPPEYAEFRGPGVHHYVNDSDDYDMDMDHRNRNSSGRIIVLGDGTEVLTDNTDSDMFDKDGEHGEKGANADKARGEREGTPGPDQASTIERTHTPESTATDEPKTKAVADDNKSTSPAKKA